MRTRMRSKLKLWSATYSATTSPRGARHDRELPDLTKGFAVLERLRPAPARSALYDLRGLPEQNLARGGAQRMAHKEAHGKGQEHGMTREEIIELRKATFDRVERMRKTGDYAAGASDIRENGEALLKLMDHLLERMR